MTDEIEKLEAYANTVRPTDRMAVSPVAILSLIDRLKKAEAELAAIKEQKPVLRMERRKEETPQPYSTLIPVWLASMPPEGAELYARPIAAPAAPERE